MGLPRFENLPEYDQIVTRACSLTCTSNQTFPRVSLAIEATSVVAELELDKIEFYLI
jgi:hypothetical protein